MKTVPELLKDKAILFEEKGKQYGNSYKDFGKIMKQLTDWSISEDDWNRIGLYHMLVHKLMRIGKKILAKNISIDSVQDLQVYAAMLEEIIAEQKGKEDANHKG